MLVLTGVLLVLGFVIVGSTIVQLQSMEEQTARAQRTSISTSTDELMTAFESTVRGTTKVGWTNLTDFHERAERATVTMKSSAVRSGLYVSALLEDDPPAQFLLQHCGGYHNGRSGGGVVVGYTEDTLEESIVGAVYNIHITDGSKNLRWLHYVEIFDCSEHLIYTYANESALVWGSEVNLTHTKSASDGGLSMELREELTGTVTNTVYPAIVVSGDSKKWLPTANVHANDSVPVSHVSTGGDDRFVYTVVPPFGASEVASTVQFGFDLWHQPQLIGSNDDKLMFSAHHATSNRTWEVGPLTQAEARYVFNISSPSGNGHWTYQELATSTFKLWVQEMNGKDVTRVWQLDYVDTKIQYTEPRGYTLNLTFDWTDIPELYQDHILNMTYSFAAGGTPGEQFELQVWDTQAPAHWDTVATFSDQGGWTAITPVVLTATQYNDNDPLLRIRDLDLDDDEQDTIYIDWLAIDSKANNDP